MTVKYDAEIFDVDDVVQRDLIWWLIRKLGGAVEVPTTGEVNTAFPQDRSLVMYKQEGKVILAAERLDEPSV